MQLVARHAFVIVYIGFIEYASDILQSLYLEVRLRVL